MLVIDFENNKEYTQENFPEDCKDSFMMLVSCSHEDMLSLRDILILDDDTILDSVNIDESVRFTAFEGYDFASLFHLEVNDDEVLTNEINLYISKQYIVLVMPENATEKLKHIENQLITFTKNYMKNKNLQTDKSELINQTFFLFFDLLITDFFETLELLEDRMQELSKEISIDVSEENFNHIQNLREVAYAIKKVLRAFSYIGFQILCNENSILSSEKMYLFRNLETRFRKLYDFSESVYGLSSELIRTYDSKTAQRTNDIINKLTFVTIIFAPLTLITGIYGMNFVLMPELKLPWGYPVALVVMLIISISLFALMKKKKWF